MITTDIVWDHRKRTKAGSEGPLEVRVTVDRKPYYINTGIKVRKNEFKAGMIVNRPDADTLRTRLNILYKKIDNADKEYLNCDTISFKKDKSISGVGFNIGQSPKENRPQLVISPIEDGSFLRFDKKEATFLYF